jgi:hypothetical protein
VFGEGNCFSYFSAGGAFAAQVKHSDPVVNIGVLSDTSGLTKFSSSGV